MKTPRSLDVTVASILALIAAAGTTLNLLSFLYFKNQKPRNDNSCFFRRVYLAITLTDTLICFVLVPVVDAGFTPDRAGYLFHGKTFCEVWTVIWWILPQTSVLLVGLLSASRLVVLVRPGARLALWLPWLLPSVFVVLIVAVYVGGFLSGALFPQYVTDWMYCAVLPVPMGEPNREVSLLEWKSGIFLFTVASLAPAISLLLISTSFAISLVVLKRQTKTALSVGGSIRKQQKASKTVFIITFIYILFNIPSTIALLGILIKIASTLTYRKIEIKEYILEYIKSSSPEKTFSAYVIVLVSLLPVSLNSLANPVVYFYRIEAFRQYFRSQLRKSSRIVRMCLSRSTSVFRKSSTNFNSRNQELTNVTMKTTSDRSSIVQLGVVIENKEQDIKSENSLFETEDKEDEVLE
ncbi:hypothetical protein ACHWQZ_G002738 [Mnemiopsis leidyi]